MNQPERSYSKLYVCDKNTISLILFVDGASFSKTGSKGSIWSMFGFVIDIKPPRRYYLENMITIFLIGSTNPNLIEFFAKYLNAVDKLT